MPRRTAASRAAIVYQAIYEEADHELSRDSGGLAWSGLAAGLSMGFSMIVQAILRVCLPDTEWQPLVSRLGYTVGFLIVILGRQQLFTENTLKPVLPLLRNWSRPMLFNVGRLWSVVLITNLLGGFVLAWVVAHSNVVSADVRQECLELAREAHRFSFGTVVVRGIFAGWLIALMIWLLPFAETARVWVIIIVSYVVGLGEFTHIIAGGIESFYLVANGEISIGQSLTGYLFPALIGNVIGGVSLVAALAHAQFMAAGRGEEHNTDRGSSTRS